MNIIRKQVKTIVYEDGSEIEMKAETTYFLLVESKLDEANNEVIFDVSYGYTKLLENVFINQIFMHSIIFKLMKEFNVIYQDAYKIYKEEIEEQRLKIEIFKNFGCEE